MQVISCVSKWDTIDGVASEFQALQVLREEDQFLANYDPSPLQRAYFEHAYL
jgi:hypothetical protein